MYQKGERRREEILRATMSLIGAHGADAVTHRAVAEEAGVPLSATTYYFASKEDLLEQTFLLAAREETERLERLVLDLAPLSLSAQRVGRERWRLRSRPTSARSPPSTWPSSSSASRPPAPSSCATSSSAGRRRTCGWPRWGAAPWGPRSPRSTPASWWRRSRA